MDSLTHRLEREIRETCPLRAACDPPDADAYESLMARLATIRERIPRDDVFRLEVLIERVTGCACRPKWTGRD